MTAAWLALLAVALVAAVRLGGPLSTVATAVTRPPVGLLAAFAAATAGVLALGRVAAQTTLDRSGALLLPALAVGVAAVVLVVAAWQRGGPVAAGIVAPAVLLATVGLVVGARLRDGDVRPVLPLAAAGTALLVLALVRLPLTETAGRLLAVAGLLLIALPSLPVVGVRRNGASLWIRVPGGVEIQPGEPGRVLLVLGVAILVARYARDLRRVGRRYGTAPLAVRPTAAAAGAGLIGVVLMVTQRDLGPALIVVTALGVTIWLSAGRARYLAVAVGSLAGLAVALYPFLSYLQRRVAEWRDPLAGVGGAAGDLTQVAAARFALAWGGWWGTGLGGALTERRGRIPAAESDYVLAQIGAETGLVGLLLTLAAVVLVVVRVWMAVAATGGGAATAVTAGLAAMLSVQVCATAWGVAGLVPLTGVTTPLLSAGGSALVATALLLALLVAVAGPDHRTAVGAPWVRRGATGAAVTAVALVAVSATAFADTSVVSARRWNTDPHGVHARWAAAAPPGRVLAADGTVLAVTEHGGAADRSRRTYPTGPLFADAVGYAIPFGSSAGVEKAWSGALRCGATAPQAADPGAGYASPPAGVDPGRCAPADVVLTIEPGWQRRAAEALAGRVGAVVVLDPADGAVLAAVSTPTVDPNPLTDPDVERALAAGAALLQAPVGPARPGAWAVPLPPGSVFKLVTGAAALRAGNGRPGPLDDATCPAPGLVEALAHSCNPPFLDLARRLGPRRLADEAEPFGFGRPVTLSGLPVAPAAAFAGPADRAAADVLEVTGIGQGEVRATLLHLTALAATVATGGVRAEPTLVRALCDGDDPVWTSPPRTRTVLDPVTVDWLGRGMRAVVTGGTATRALGGLAGDWAAKTGTAELGEGRQAAWTVAFPTAPPDGRRVVVGVLVRPDAGRPAPVGGLDAAPVVAALASGPLPSASASGRDRGPCPATG